MRLPSSSSARGGRCDDARVVLTMIAVCPSAQLVIAVPEARFEARVADREDPSIRYVAHGLERHRVSGSCAMPLE
jgi:hypothetical protein